MTTAELAIRMATAAALGGLVGAERHRADKAAGLRTHMLVSVGSCLFMVVSSHGFDEVLRPSLVQLDPSRVAAQVVSGIGFLGAGAILRRHEAVLGLTTAASIWAVAAVGLAAGGGMIAAAVTATAVIVLTLTAMRWVEDRISVRPGSCALLIMIRDDEPAARLAGEELCRPGVAISAVRYSAVDGQGVRRIEAIVEGPTSRELLALAARLQSAPGVLEVSIERRGA